MKIRSKHLLNLHHIAHLFSSCWEDWRLFSGTSNHASQVWRAAFVNCLKRASSVVFKASCTVRYCTVEERYTASRHIRLRHTTTPGRTRNRLARLHTHVKLEAATCSRDWSSYVAALAYPCGYPERSFFFPGRPALSCFFVMIQYLVTDCPRTMADPCYYYVRFETLRGGLAVQYDDLTWEEEDSDDGGWDEMRWQDDG